MFFKRMPHKTSAFKGEHVKTEKVLKKCNVWSGQLRMALNKTASVTDGKVDETKVLQIYKTFACCK